MSVKYYIPTIGIIIFIGLYIFSTTLYPGGSQIDVSSTGFDWLHNYWCTMFEKIAINGEPNPARSYSIAGMIILWFSLLVFFYMFSDQFVNSIIWKNIIKISGTIALIFAGMIFTGLHDLMSILSSIVGIITLIGIIVALVKSKLKLFKITGLICVFMLAINNYIYYTELFIIALPFTQKITTVIVLLWVIGLNFQIIKLKPTSLSDGG